VSAKTFFTGAPFMNPLQAYQQSSRGWTRIDLLLTLYDEIIRHMEEAMDSLGRGDRDAQLSHLARARLAASVLASGVNPAVGAVAVNYQRLYDYLLYSLDAGRADNVEGALRVVRTLREGFAMIRGEAARMEYCGEIPPLDRSCTLSASA